MGSGIQSCANHSRGGAANPPDADLATIADGRIHSAAAQRSRTRVPLADAAAVPVRAGALSKRNLLDVSVSVFLDLHSLGTPSARLRK